MGSRKVISGWPLANKIPFRLGRAVLKKVVLERLLDVHFLPTDLNPFHRFSSELESNPSERIQEYLETREGLVLEVLAAQHCKLNKKPCLHCQKATMVWGGGSGASWRDMVCKTCGSYYEIKVKNAKAIKKVNDKEAVIFHGVVNGGSFKFAHSQEGAGEDGGCPAHFMIVIDRLSLKATSGWVGSVGSAYKSRIRSCLPQLTSGCSLHEQDSVLRGNCKCWDFLKKGNRLIKWFDIPRVPNWSEVSKRILQGLFAEKYPVVFGNGACDWPEVWPDSLSSFQRNWKMREEEGKRRGEGGVG